MKLTAALFTTALLFQLPAPSQQVNVRGECYRNVEEYIPGYNTPDGRYVNGYVRTDRQSVPCGGGYYNTNSGGEYTTQSTPRCDRNSTIFNGLLGGGIAAALSKPDAYAWSVPFGVALGVSSSRIGCK